MENGGAFHGGVERLSWLIEEENMTARKVFSGTDLLDDLDQEHGLCLYFTMHLLPQKLIDRRHNLSYNSNAKPTALPPETARRQFFSFSKARKAVVFIDGSNWYHKLKKLISNEHEGNVAKKPPIDFAMRKFSQTLVMPDTLDEIRYYIGKVRRLAGDVKSVTLSANQQKLFHFLQRQHITVGFGHLIPYPDGSFHEKGVDVLLAVEMIRLAIAGAYDVAYLISSDTDLVPAVLECMKLGRKVVYVGSSLHGQSFGLARCCHRTILLRPKDVLDFLPPKLV